MNNFKSTCMALKSYKYWPKELKKEFKFLIKIIIFSAFFLFFPVIMWFAFKKYTHPFSKEEIYICGIYTTLFGMVGFNRQVRKLDKILDKKNET